MITTHIPELLQHNGFLGAEDALTGAVPSSGPVADSGSDSSSSPFSSSASSSASSGSTNVARARRADTSLPVLGWPPAAMHLFHWAFNGNETSTSQQNQPNQSVLGSVGSGSTEGRDNDDEEEEDDSDATDGDDSGEEDVDGESVSINVLSCPIMTPVIYR